MIIITQAKCKGLTRKRGKDKRWADSDIHVDLFVAWGRTHGAYDLCRQLSHLWKQINMPKLSLKRTKHINCILKRIKDTLASTIYKKSAINSFLY